MELNEFGQIAYNFWWEIPVHFPDATIDGFVIMPDHIHGIIEIPAGNAAVVRNAISIVGNVIRPVVGNADLRSLRRRPENNDRTKMMIPKIIHGYKSSVTRTIHRQYQINFQWQKSYHDRIIRNQDELNRIREYIQNNPRKWEMKNSERNAVWNAENPVRNADLRSVWGKAKLV